MKSEIGTISKWNDEKGFGFITPKSGGKSIFIHINEFSRRHMRPSKGLSVNFERTKDSKGRNCATNVYPLKGHRKATRVDNRVKYSIIFSCTFIAFVGLLVAFDKLPLILPAVYMLLSVVAFTLYKKDKAAAEWNEWRVPENTLHFVAIIGGWPGALIAQNLLRHKSRKLSFRIVYWATVVINCGLLSWIMTRDGAEKLKVLMEKLNIG